MLGLHWTNAIVANVIKRQRSLLISVFNTFDAYLYLRINVKFVNFTHYFYSWVSNTYTEHVSIAYYAHEMWLDYTRQDIKHLIQLCTDSAIFAIDTKAISKLEAMNSKLQAVT